jgi:dienelactone hydrolase
MATQPVRIEIEALTLQGLLRLAPGAQGLVLFAHGSGSGRLSPRNTFVAERLGAAGIGTLLFDLLSEEEERIDALTAELRFDIPLLTERLLAATRWTLQQPELAVLPLGYFGASTGAAAALAAAARAPEIAAVVSRGGRPDLAGAALPEVRAPTLLIVGGDDRQVLALNREALARMRCTAEIAVVPGATHLFEEPGTLEQVAALAARWFAAHLQPRASGARPRQQ